MADAAYLDFLTDEERERAARIAKDNDAFRAAMTCGGVAELQGQYLITKDIYARGPAFAAFTQLTVAGDATFTEDNDPYGDHSFGRVIVCNEPIFWKIDLYDATYEFGAEDPFNAEQTRRVLTIMFPHEY